METRRGFLKTATAGCIAGIATSGMGPVLVKAAENAKETSGDSGIYKERYRPQFHFTAKKNWLNDPNGLVFYKGQYHLFFQHNPSGIEWGNMTWGHAVSPDLVHWTQLDNAILPDNLGTIFSGSAVVDWNNTAGFQSGTEKTIVCIYTSAGEPFTQSIAYSTDGGKTFRKYDRNPVLPHIIGSNRDPKVVWHAPTHKWIMALFKDGNVYAFFSSPDLKTWTHLQDITVPGCGECPDFFEIPLDGDCKNTRWVWTSASGHYLVGTFDGQRFVYEGDPIRGDFGANFYAVQTYSDIPAKDGRRIQITWMSGGKYPEMPFNQQMSFPCTLELRTLPDGIRICRMPVKEIEHLYAGTFTLKDKTLEETGGNPLAKISGDLFDIELVVEPRQSTEFGLRLHDQAITFAANTISCLGKTAPLSPINGVVKLRILADRTSLEVFGNDGVISMTSCFLPKNPETGLELYSKGGSIRIRSLKVRKLRSAWE